MSNTIERSPREDSFVDISRKGDHEAYTITEQLFQQLEKKGFTENAIKKSIVAGCIDESTCTQWINMHEGHPERDTPLEEGVIVEIKPKKILTEEERQKKIEELREKAKAKRMAREAEEKAEELRREKERIEFRRTALEVEKKRKEMLKEKEIRDAEKQRKLDAMARHRARVQVKADTLVRAGKSEEEARKIAEELISQEEEEAARKEAEMKERQKPPKVAEASPISAPLVLPPNPIDVLDNIFKEPPMDTAQAIACLRNLKECHTGSGNNPVSLLQTILSNIYGDPLNNKMRVFKTTTNTFMNRIFPFPDLLRILRFCNFDVVDDAEGNKVVMSNVVVMQQLKQLLDQF